MLFFWIVLVVVVVFAADSMMVTLVHRRAAGRFDILAEWQRMLVFRSSAGIFSLRQDLRLLEYPLDGSRRSARFQDIEALELRVRSEDALLGEFLLDPCMDEAGRSEQDYIDWYLISAVLRGGEKILLFRGGKYHRRKYLHDFYTEVQLAILEALGMLVDVDAQSRGILERIRPLMGGPEVVHLRD